MVVGALGDGGEDHATVALARGLRDTGMEVVHAGRSSLERLADTVVQEDVDAVGLPVLPADPAERLARLAALLADRGVDDVVVFACGADAELPGGIRFFPPGTAPAEVAGWLRGQLIGEPPRSPGP
ncbi:methylmalonyl-CoA mutase, C-terminal domain [Geodermatophilus poikilotrophus]|uniref:Methylmalonyl-CoA mutase, C-terminal domain n=1 Tax=Geodermatophilus poikilotrophus TaxID=1333667 RepID=A0A1I0H724_9ACTN|nr:methylmalonyl-CoA mutase, C-terminal domain [Geodermatophilus poikilotrophus]